MERRQKTGQGTCTFGAKSEWVGEKYVGEYKFGRKNGQGTYNHANGDEYIGEFKDGQAHGQGIYTFADGTVKEGIWEDGEYLGK